MQPPFACCSGPLWMLNIYLHKDKMLLLFLFFCFFWGGRELLWLLRIRLSVQQCQLKCLICYQTRTHMLLFPVWSFSSQERLSCFTKVSTSWNSLGKRWIEFSSFCFWGQRSILSKISARPLKAVQTKHETNAATCLDISQGSHSWNFKPCELVYQLSEIPSSQCLSWLCCSHSW